MNSSIATPKQERSRNSMDRILEGAFELLVEKGFEAMSLREVCQRADLTVGAFYARFSKKQDLALALAARLGERCEKIVEEVAATESGNFGEAVRRLLEGCIRMYRQDRGQFRLQPARLRGGRGRSSDSATLQYRQQVSNNDRTYKPLRQKCSG